MTVDRKTWVIIPRDPLVFGTGVPPTAFAARAGALPPPNTVAGMVRARFVANGSHVHPARAAELLDRISVRGPWLRGHQVKLLHPDDGGRRARTGSGFANICHRIGRSRATGQRDHNQQQ